MSSSKSTTPNNNNKATKTSSSKKATSSPLFPPEASKWISTCFGVAPDNCVTYTSCYVLTLKELKQIYNKLRTFPFCYEHRKPLKRQNKVDLITEIRQCFYTDDECSTVNAAAMKVLKEQTKNHNQNQSAGASQLMPPFPSVAWVMNPNSATAGAGGGGTNANAAAAAHASSASGPAPAGMFAFGVPYFFPPHAGPYPVLVPTNPATAAPMGFGFAAAATPTTKAPPQGNTNAASAAPSSSASATATRPATATIAAMSTPMTARTTARAKTSSATAQSLASPATAASSSQKPDQTHIRFPRSSLSSSRMSITKRPASLSTPSHRGTHVIPSRIRDSTSRHSWSSGGHGRSSAGMQASPSLLTRPHPSSMVGGTQSGPGSRASATQASVIANAERFIASTNALLHGSTAPTHAPLTTAVSGGGGISNNNTSRNPDTTPQNGQESKLLNELLSMGFTDPAEVLISIRKLAETHGPQLTSEQVLCDVVQMRDEAEFARQMDQARLASERDRRKDAEERRKANAAQHDEELQNATVKEWVENKDMFRGSWLLKSSCRETLLAHVTESTSTFKVTLIELLKLEKKSRQWYGQVLPSYYFDEVLAEKLSGIECVTRLEDALKKETKILHDGLMLLSNQQGNVPTLFLEAKDARRERTGGADNDNDDDEVILVETRRPSFAGSPGKKARVETIETIS